MMTVPHSEMTAVPQALELIGCTILLVDDDPIQLRLVKAHLEDAGFEVVTASSASAAIDAAKQAVPHAILSDIVMDELDGFALCGILRAEPQLLDVPIVLMTSHIRGAEDHRIASATGANALVQRSSDFSAEFEALRLAMSLRHHPRSTERPHQEGCVSRIAPQMWRLVARSRHAEDRYKTLFDYASDAMAVLTPDGVLIEMNRQWEEILQRPREDMLGRHIREFAAPGHEESNDRDYRDAISPAGKKLAAVPIVGPDGRTLYMEFSNRLVDVGGESVVLAIGRNVTDSVEANRRLAVSELRYRTLIEGIPDVVWSSTTSGQVLFMSSRVEHVCGFTPREVIDGGPQFWLGRVHPEDLAGVQHAWSQVPTGQYRAEYRWQHRAGHWIWLRSHAGLRVDERGVDVAEGTFADITGEKRLEEQLQVSQKMEAIGQLTGGIAHDFNNMLGVVLGNTEFLLGDMSMGDPRRVDVESIRDAGLRAAALTRQLLTFSRQQIVEMREIEPARVVRDLEKLLERVIGEDVEVTTLLAPDTGTVRADAGQLEQVVMNLVVNARDAMPQGGKLAIETSNVEVDEEVCQATGGMTAGSYVMLSVSDTGCGIDQETRAKIFEPFFTTKPVGQGTGLGLSTCYGIVKRSNGFIGVYSEVGRGTTFKVYLPRVSATETAATRAASSSITDCTGGETVLVIEDNEQLRSVICRTLRSLGYELLEANNGEEALNLHAANAGCIDLVLTDVVMPGISGPDVVCRIKDRGGAPRVLYMSGYTEHAALRDQRLDPSLNFIQKPFSPATIAKKVRAVLDLVEVQ